MSQESVDQSGIQVAVRQGLPTIIIVGAPDAYTARVREILRQRDRHFLSRVTVNIVGPVPPHAAVADAIEAAGEPKGSVMEAADDLLAKAEELHALLRAEDDGMIAREDEDYQRKARRKIPREQALVDQAVRRAQ